MERMQARDGAGGAGRDGVVVVFHAVQFAHKLDPVLHAGERLRYGVDVRVCGKTLDSTGRSHIVFNVVDAGDADVGSLHNGGIVAVNGVAVQPHAAFRAAKAGELLDCTRSALREAVGDGVVHVDDELAGPALVQVDVLLGGDVLGHILVDVEVVRREVRHNGDVR